MRKRIFLVLLLVLLIIVSCDDDNDSTNPQPTPTPSYANIQCVDLTICEDASDIWDYRIRVGAIFQNLGTATGTSDVMLWVEQPRGVIAGTFTMPLTLSPNESRLIQHIFSEPTLGGGTVYCYCDVP